MCCSLPCLRGFENSLSDGYVRTAAAQVTTESGSHLRFGRVRIVAEKGLSGKDHSRRAETALRAIMLDHGSDQRIVGRNAFDRLDGLALCIHGQHAAGVNRFSIHEHRATAACSTITGRLRSGKVELIAKSIEQSDTWLDRELPRLSV